MGINHGASHVCMTQQLLDGANVATRLEKVCREAMPERMTTRRLGDARLAHRELHRALRSFLMHMVSNEFTGKRAYAKRARREYKLPTPLNR